MTTFRKVLKHVGVWSYTRRAEVYVLLSIPSNARSCVSLSMSAGVVVIRLLRTSTKVNTVSDDITLSPAAATHHDRLRLGVRITSPFECSQAATVM